MTIATSEGSALLRAILINPKDDDVRLIYSDWLEENGDMERAEYIRLQIQEPSSSWQRQQRLLERNAKKWLGYGLRSMLRKGVIASNGYEVTDKFSQAVHFVHGFPTILWTVFDWCYPHLGEIMAEVPISEICFTDRYPSAMPGGNLWAFRAISEEWVTGHSRNRNKSLIPDTIPLKSGAIQYEPGWEQRLYVYDAFNMACSDLSNAAVAYGRARAGITEPADAQEAS